VFSRLARWKGQHIILEALARATEWRALIVGGALFGGDEAYERELKRKAMDLNLADRVRFLGFRDDIPELLRSVDVVAHTSIAPEPFGRVIVEGMLAGKPVIAARGGGVGEIIEHGVTGFLVKPGDVDELAVALTRLVARPSERDAIGEVARREATERFSIEAMVRGIEREMDALA
jgi:glycosyltransferase involved in cell wall biosynthesis